MLVERLASLRVMGSAKCSGHGCNSVTMYRQRSHCAGHGLVGFQQENLRRCTKSQGDVPIRVQGHATSQKDFRMSTVKYF